ncbi:hypothetical protein CNMCM5793_004847 [Aspergillus hiratsukae]|uniref:Hydrophobic surface binding protein A-domain-containing protein n=1 Tax=Aspergillus hiratsukae TaxID=1194566 RepID=A0A8H6UAZ0_9EURO|nr:hypothetical protein CNMCM5793_004847 [Aspergillus hiratsukae]
MLFSSLTPIALLVALATSALGATTAKQTVNDMTALHESVIKARESLEGWNGGLMGAIPVASKIQGVQSAAANARRSIDDADGFDGEDSEAVMAAYQKLQPEIVGALNAAEKQAPAFKDAGVGFVARAMVNDLKTEKDKFETAMQQKLPAENYRKASPSVAEVDAAFDNARKALAA